MNRRLQGRSPVRGDRAQPPNTRVRRFPLRLSVVRATAALVDIPLQVGCDPRIEQAPGVVGYRELEVGNVEARSNET